MNKKKTIVLGIFAVLILTVIFFLPHENTQQEEAISMNDRGGDSFMRWFKIKFQGDTSAYDDAKIEALEYSKRNETFLNYALIMADDHNYTPAFLDVYFCMYEKQELYNDTLYTLDSLSENEIKMALHYLLQAKNRGNLEALEYIENYYKQGKYFKKDSILGLQLIKENYKRFENK